MPDEDRDAVLAALRISAVGNTLAAGVFDGQTAEEIDQGLAAIEASLDTWRERAKRLRGGQ